MGAGYDPPGSASSLEGETWEVPGPIGSTTPNTGAFTTLASNAYTGIVSAIGTAQTAGHTLTNATAALVGAQVQRSPMTIWSGAGWKTDATAASQAVAFAAQVVPVAGTAAPTGSWQLASSINGGAYANVFGVNDTGGATLGAASAVTGSLKFAHASVAFTTTLRASATTAASITYVLPTDKASAGQVLYDAAGNGVLGWTTISTSAAFSALTGSTNTTAAMVVGTGASLSFAVQLPITYTSVASTPGLYMSGAWFSGGTATTTKPHLLIEPSANVAGSTIWSTGGTAIGAYASTGFTGDFLHFHAWDGPDFTVNSAGNIVMVGTSGGIKMTGATRSGCILTTGNQMHFGDYDSQDRLIWDWNARVLYVGSGLVNTSAITSTLQGTGGSGTDKTAGNFVVVPGVSTGAGVGASFLVQTSTTLGTGTTVQTPVTRLTIGGGTVTTGDAAATLTTTTLVHAAGTTTLAPAKFVTGTLLTSPVAGVVEYTTPSWYVTSGDAVRQKLGQSAYGALILTSDATTTVTTAGTFYQITNTSAGPGLLTVPSATSDNITISTGGDGDYIVRFSASVTHDNALAKYVQWKLYKNGSAVGTTASCITTYLGTGNNYTSCSFDVIITGLIATDTLDIRVTAETNGMVVGYNNGTLSAIRIAR